jgi:glutamate-1-semialdehyde 2,1-aminomutase
MRKIGIFIIARMGSQRLSGKHLMKVGSYEALALLFLRINNEFQADFAKGECVISLLTGNYNDNKELIEMISKIGFLTFSGDDANIPLRILQASKEFSVDGIVSVDGDDVFCSPDAIRSVYRNLKSGITLTKTVGLPFGMNAWGFSTANLEKALAKVSYKVLETGWARLFNSISFTDVIFSDDVFYKKIRATLDYREDLIFFQRCIGFTKNPITATTNELLEIIKKYNLQNINSFLSYEYETNFKKNIILENNLMDRSNEFYSNRLHAVIPGGSHTYSRGDDQFPGNAPQILEGGKGAYVWGPDGKKYLDYGMALRSVSIGYSEPEINRAAFDGIELGNNLTRPSLIELQAAERLVDLIDSVDLVKFTKNGSTATTAAIKLARAITGRELIARCAQHPFFSFDDWFIGSTPITKGIPSTTIRQTKLFNYNDIESLEKLILEYPNKIACVILEPAALECPSIWNKKNECCEQPICNRKFEAGENFLQQVERVCNKNGIVFILDETITGFRWNVKGAQHIFGVTPDITTFGKAMANGFSVSAIGGKKEIMSLGSINNIGQERLFLLSTTHGAEMSSLSAFNATVNFIKNNGVIEKNWKYGYELKSFINLESKKYGIQSYFKVVGPAVNPSYLTLDSQGNNWLELRTLFLQEMINQGVIMPWISICYRHGVEEMEKTKEATTRALEICAYAIKEGIHKYLKGPVIKPVFRKFN